MKTIIIQGAMDDEIESYLKFYKGLEKQVIHGFSFYVGTFNGCKIVISLTDKGVINATESTVVGIYEFSPDLIINQGTAGAHLKSLDVGDLIVAENAVYMNKFKTPPRKENSGSNSLEWEPMLKDCFNTPASTDVLNHLKSKLSGKGVHFGTVGSGDMFSREIDRINFLVKTFGHMCEDMETAAVYKVCENFKVKHIAVRIISNNEMKEGLGTRKENIEKIAPKITKVITDLVEEATKEIAFQWQTTNKKYSTSTLECFVFEQFQKNIN